jgi:hypothetical protein
MLSNKYFQNKAIKTYGTTVVVISGALGNIILATTQKQ